MGRGGASHIVFPAIRAISPPLSPHGQQHVHKLRTQTIHHIRNRANQAMAGAMVSLILKLGELLKEEYKLQTGAREKIQSLSRELDSIHAALDELSKVPPEKLDQVVRLWASDIRELSYDMDDAVDTFLVCVDGHDATIPGCLARLVEVIGRFFGKTKVCHQIAGVIERINAELLNVANRRGRYTVSNIVTNSTTTTASTIDTNLSALFTDATHLVGIDGPKYDLIKMLSMEEMGVPQKKMKIVSIVGAGGLGKTTLAKAVYDNIKAQFQCCAFVPVGQNSDIKRIFKDILIDLDKRKYENIHDRTWDERLLIKEVREFLENKRYIIVIDDIWQLSTWEVISCSLVDNNCGSRVITTTRIFDVATDVGQVYRANQLCYGNADNNYEGRVITTTGIPKVAMEFGEVYKIKQLPYDSSKSLFYTRIFGSKDNNPYKDYDLDKLSHKILEKCEGVPLAIITVASLLANKRMEDWNKVYESIVLGHEDNRYLGSTMKILSLSYYDLPCHLKTCLLYLSIFPEDYVIDKHQLIWSWISEGLIRKEHGRGIFELGEFYFDQLINRGMIMPFEAEDEGYILGCRVHDMVLALIRSLSSKENFVTLLDDTFAQNTSCRRLAIHGRNVEQRHMDNLNIPHVRSFHGMYMSDIGVLPSLMLSFKVLRVLDLQNCSTKEGSYDLRHLCNLLHLRYLGLTNSSIRELPTDIGQWLRFLQTLDLWETGIEELPSSVGLLTKLLCLRASEKTRVPVWIGNLTSLQELWIWCDTDQVSPRNFVNGLGKLTELRVLRTSITCDDPEWDDNIRNTLVQALCNLDKIRIMHILGALRRNCTTWEAGFVSPKDINYLYLCCLCFHSLPVWIDPSFFPNLIHLNLSVQVVGEQDMEILGSLQMLCSLQLIGMSSPVVSIPIHGADGALLFHKLRFFTMGTSIRFVQHNVAPAVASITVFPKLESLSAVLYVRFYKDQHLDFDFGLGHLPISLRKVKVFIGCHYACEEEVAEAEDTLYVAVFKHPALPALELERLGENRMVQSDQNNEVGMNRSDFC
uniref:AAA+ ATPase domain-containing protein n=1 Tax=Leersia perrieri TaxID=77586 RepID=A0A0D9XYY9_9ORYZ